MINKIITILSFLLIILASGCLCMDIGKLTQKPIEECNVNMEMQITSSGTVLEPTATSTEASVPSPVLTAATTQAVIPVPVPELPTAVSPSTTASLDNVVSIPDSKILNPITDKAVPTSTASNNVVSIPSDINSIMILSSQPVSATPTETSGKESATTSTDTSIASATTEAPEAPVERSWAWCWYIGVCIILIVIILFIIFGRKNQTIKTEEDNLILDAEKIGTNIKNEATTIINDIKVEAQKGIDEVKSIVNPPSSSSSS